MQGFPRIFSRKFGEILASKIFNFVLSTFNFTLLNYTPLLESNVFIVFSAIFKSRSNDLFLI